VRRASPGRGPSRAVARGHGARRQSAGARQTLNLNPAGRAARACLRGGSSIASQMELLPSACARCALPGSSAASSASLAPPAPAPAAAAAAAARLRYARRLVYARRALPGSARRSKAVRHAAARRKLCTWRTASRQDAHNFVPTCLTQSTQQVAMERAAQQCSCKRSPMCFRPSGGEEGRARARRLGVPVLLEVRHGRVGVGRRQLGVARARRLLQRLQHRLSQQRLRWLGPLGGCAARAQRVSVDAHRSNTQ
jgi:hypothetical protein